MAASRVLYPPLSGRDRRHYAGQIHKAEMVYAAAKRDAEAAHAAADLALQKAHRLDCEAWSALQFIGGSDDPSPTIAAALHAGCPMLEAQCRHCNHTQMVDLAEVVWPREKPVHTLRKVLYCQPCLEQYRKKRRPDLVGLRVRDEHGPKSTAMAMR